MGQQTLLEAAEPVPKTAFRHDLSSLVFSNCRIHIPALSAKLLYASADEGSADLARGDASLSLLLLLLFNGLKRHNHIQPKRWIAEGAVGGGA